MNSKSLKEGNFCYLGFFLILAAEKVAPSAKILISYAGALTTTLQIANLRPFSAPIAFLKGIKLQAGG